MFVISILLVVYLTGVVATILLAGIEAMLDRPSGYEHPVADENYVELVNNPLKGV